MEELDVIPLNGSQPVSFSYQFHGTHAALRLISICNNSRIMGWNKYAAVRLLIGVQEATSAMVSKHTTALLFDSANILTQCLIIINI